jgi:hypothetical protein
MPRVYHGLSLLALRVTNTRTVGAKPIRRHAHTPIRRRVPVTRSPLPDYDRRATDDNDTAVRRGVTHSSCHQISNQYGRRTHGNRIGWSNTRAHVRGARRRLTADQDGRTTGRQDRSTNVGDRRCTWSDHRASVHVTYSGGWRHSCFSLI